MKPLNRRLWMGLALMTIVAPVAVRAQFDGGYVDGMGFQYNPVAAVQQQIGATDEEWTAVQPRLQRVVDTQAIVQSASGYAGRAGAGGATGQNAVSNALADLQAAVDKGGTPAQINARIKAFRDALNKAKADNKTAQEDLRKILTVRQEGLLIALGYLE